MKDSNFKYFFLNSVNFLYLVCGITLIIGSITVLTDADRILISRLIPVDSPEPVLYYVCLAVLAVGLLVSTLSTVGCWAIYTGNNCLLASYIFGVVVLLIGEGVFGVVTVMCPEYLGFEFSRDASVPLWQNSYGVPDKEQYTVAIDLLQVQFECCGVNSGNDYSKSWWHVNKELTHSPNLTVPISCCFLNENVTKSYLDPVPIDLASCQDTSIEKFHNFRHQEGCYFALENWLREQKRTLLFSAVLNFAIQLLILFAVISSCVTPRQMVYDANKRSSHSYLSHNAMSRY